MRGVKSNVLVVQAAAMRASVQVPRCSFSGRTSRGDLAVESLPVESIPKGVAVQSSARREMMMKRIQARAGPMADAALVMQPKIQMSIAGALVGAFHNSFNPITSFAIGIVDVLFDSL